jgi:thymidylate kinase
VVPWLLVRTAPHPGLVLLLDAPGEVMFARKGELTVELLEERRQSYLAMARADPAFVVLDATSPPEEVARRAMSAIWNCWPRPPASVTPSRGPVTRR